MFLFILMHMVYEPIRYTKVLFRGIYSTSLAINLQYVY